MYQVLRSFIASFGLLNELATRTETEVFETYLESAWAQVPWPSSFSPHVEDLHAIALMRLVVQAQTYDRQVAVRQAFERLPADDRHTLGTEMARTGAHGQHYARCTTEQGASPCEGPAILVYYSPAFVRILTPDHGEAALRLLAEVYRCSRKLWPLKLLQPEPEVEPMSVPYMLPPTRAKTAPGRITQGASDASFPSHQVLRHGESARQVGSVALPTVSAGIVSSTTVLDTDVPETVLPRPDPAVQAADRAGAIASLGANTADTVGPAASSEEAQVPSHVTIRIDQIKDLQLHDIHGVYARGESWALVKRNELEAVIERQPIDRLTQLVREGVEIVPLRFWRFDDDDELPGLLERTGSNPGGVVPGEGSVSRQEFATQLGVEKMRDAMSLPIRI